MHRSQDTTKQASAQNQIEAAIIFWKSRKYDCCITMAGAAEEQCKCDSSGSLFYHIKNTAKRRGINESEIVSDVNETRNWLKHETPSLNTSRRIEEREAIFMLMRAIGNYHTLYDDSSDAIDEFVKWCQEEWLPHLAE